MAGRIELLENKDVVPVHENKPASPGGHSNLDKVGAKLVKLSNADQLLEDTLFNIKSVSSLTKHEMKILQLIVDGNTNKKIAQKLYRTQRTVEYHRNCLMRKLDVHNAADLVKRAITMGIL